jgi:hypothetical protein
VRRPAALIVAALLVLAGDGAHRVRAQGGGGGEGAQLPSVGTQIYNFFAREDIGGCADGTAPLGFDRTRHKLVCASDSASRPLCQLTGSISPAAAIQLCLPTGTNVRASCTVSDDAPTAGSTAVLTLLTVQQPSTTPQACVSIFNRDGTNSRSGETCCTLHKSVILATLTATITPTVPTPTITKTATITPTATQTRTRTITPTVTVTPTTANTYTPTKTPTVTLVPTQTRTPTPSPVPT